MFDIDRSYINRISAEDTLQSTIIYITSKYRDNPELPKAEDFGVTAEEFDDYVDRKQDITEWEKYCRQKGMAVLGVLFCLPPIVASFYSSSNTTFFLSFLAGLILAIIPWVIFKAVDKFKKKHLYDKRHEDYIEALIAWKEKVEQ